MAVTATVVTAWQDGINAYMAVRVTEAAPLGSVEYIGSTLLIDPSTGLQKSLAQLKAELVASCQARRNFSLHPTTAPVAISGTVSL